MDKVLDEVINKIKFTPLIKYTKINKLIDATHFDVKTNKTKVS